MKNRFFLTTCLSLYTVSLCVFAGDLALPHIPLISENKASPNVMFVVDDSGSMDWEVMAQPHFAACNYHNPNNYGSCPSTYYETGIYYYTEPSSYLNIFRTRALYYLYDHRNKYSSYKAIQFADLMENDWRVFDPKFNTIYYDADVEYAPWAGPCSQSISSEDITYCENADFTDAYVHPKDGNYDHNYKVNLDNHRYFSRTHKHTYVVSLDDKGYTGTRPMTTNMVNQANDRVDIWDSHATLTFTNASRVQLNLYKTMPGSTFPTLVETATLENSEACYNALGSTRYIYDMLSNKRSLSSTDDLGCRTIAEARQNYANWFQYYRRRAFNAKASISFIMDMYPKFHYGLSYINDSGVEIKVPSNDDDILEHNLELLDNYFEDYQRQYGTPLVSALNTAGRYFKGELSGEAPIKYACQLNNTILMTDGYYNGSQPRLGDVDGDGYGSNGSTLADVARYYYIHDLDTELDDLVPTTEVDPNPKQHMNTFGVSFGIKGNLVEGTNGWPTPALTYNSNWGNPTSCDNCSEKIDDLWHAAYNGHGQFASVGNMPELVGMLQDALGQIATLNKASLSSVTVPAIVLNTDSHIYQATFATTPWHGELYAFPISKTGYINKDQPGFKSGELLNQRSHTSRVIYSFNGAIGVPFLWNSSNNYFNSFQKRYVDKYVKFINKSNRDVNNIGHADVINYLRGERRLEEGNEGFLRKRKSLLGDIVHSAPIYVGPPKLRYTEQSYLDFKAEQANRTPLIAVGANDGMLHLFHANTGEEVMAYVPGHRALWSHLPDFSNPNYEHRFFVDGEIISNDVFFSSENKWRTIIAGSLRAGGQGIYALDITEGTFSQNGSDAQKTVLFEFDDEDDADLGYTFSRPHIVKMNNGKWAIVLGNGYNSTKKVYPSGLRDRHVSSSKKAALFILFIEEGLDGDWELGKDYIKIYAGKDNKNGLAEPFPVDIDGDYKVDYIYAGDLNGELFKFDLSSSNPSDWTQSSSVKTLFYTNNPITTPIVVGPHPEGTSKGMMVYFGTGKYLETSDNTNLNQKTQAFYGIWDKNDDKQNTIEESNLLKQHILATHSNLRASSNYDIDFTKHEGWYIDLEVNGQNNGERNIGRPQLRNGRIIFVTLVPSGEDGNAFCDPSLGLSWIMELDAKDGSRLGIPPYDVNNDGYFDEADYITFIDPQTQQETKTPHSAIKSEAGMLGGTPVILTNAKNDKEYKVVSGSSGVSTKTESVDPRGQGRQSWQQVQ